MASVQFFRNSFLPTPSSRQNGQLQWGRRVGQNRLARGLRMVAARAKEEKRKAGDHYATLNVSRHASLQEIKRAYRNLARKYHPDMNKGHGAEEKFKEISSAYEVLSDKEKRAFYDRYGEVGLQTDFTASVFGSQGFDPYEVFNSFFGESNKFFGGDIDPRKNPRLDISCDLSLTFEESIFGATREVTVLRYNTCDGCNGSGAKDNGSIKQCTNCGGTGRMVRTERTPFGTVSQISTCSECKGEGTIITEFCKTCLGEVRVQEGARVKVDVPPGVSDGLAIQIEGQGSVDKKRGAIGDLYVFIHVKGKDGIKRDGTDLYSEISIDYTEAILGTTVKVETVEGERDLYIPSGTQPGDTLKFHNMGVPNINKPSSRGDHFFTIRVRIPKNISNEERSLVEELISLKETKCSSAGDNKTRRRNRSTSKKSSFWTYMRKFFRKEESRPTGFASMSVPAPVPPWTACTDVSLCISVFVLIVLASLFSLIRRVRTISARKIILKKE